MYSIKAVGIDLAKLAFSIHGARVVIANCKNKTDRTSMWVKDFVER